ncbi:UPF0161 protein At3g09310 [Humulus lupulus]|uniref:UPF0161 protein At3g09310 n=1 Tax=Humulus lupulus TaxID=3486 RepID=UPI002B409CF5|nr:UPF0161 protein At3g09310 [Humulus lupulus]XP_062095615.1 UPF0161 protein At3g09310 [Humulus lupulus]XP_062095616.1 UPF0161 protein At3g09310 [Humulus lupulus]
MAVAVSFNCYKSLSFNSVSYPKRHLLTPHRCRLVVIGCSREEDSISVSQDKEVDNLGVKAALCVLKFYKSEISPMLPKSCRFVPTCSEYSMEAYKKYGFVKGSVLTTWRICRCNPLGGSGFDPPRWFDETSLPEE